MTGQGQLTKIKGLIAKAKLKEAVDSLLQYAEIESSSQEHAIISLSSKYYELEEMSRNTTIALTDYQRIRSQLIVNLLEKVASFEAAIKMETVEISLTDGEEIYKLSIARTKVLRVLIATSEGFSIKAIHKESGLKNRKYLIAVLDELVAMELVERYKLKGVSLNKLTEKGSRIVRKWSVE